MLTRCQALRPASSNDTNTLEANAHVPAGNPAPAAPDDAEGGAAESRCRKAGFGESIAAATLGQAVGTAPRGTAGCPPAVCHATLQGAAMQFSTIRENLSSGVQASAGRDAGPRCPHGCRARAATLACSSPRAALDIKASSPQLSPPLPLNPNTTKCPIPVKLDVPKTGTSGNDLRGTEVGTLVTVCPCWA